MKGRKTVWKSILLTVMLLVWTCMAVPVLAEEASGDNSLSSLGITTEGVTVSPDFYYSTIEYQVTVPSGTSRLELDPVPSNSGASILGIDGQDIGSDGTTTVAITVRQMAIRSRIICMCRRIRRRRQPHRQQRRKLRL